MALRPPVEDVGVVDPGFWRGRRVLVTGHSGFKGVWLTLWLQSLGAHVCGLSGPPPSAPSLYELARVERDVESFDADIRDPEAVARAVAESRPEVVLHMAAQALVRRSFAQPRETYEINTMGTVNLLDAQFGEPRVRRSRERPHRVAAG